MGYLNTLIKDSGGHLSSLYQFTETTTYIDIGDKLNWQVTVNILIVLVLVVTNLSKFLNKIISCAVPIYFSDNQEEYANQICFIGEKYATNESNSIYIASNQTLVYYRRSSTSTASAASQDDDKGPHLLSSYYIWVPYVLVVQILLFLLVKCLWQCLLEWQFQELDLNELLKAANECKDVPIDKFMFFDCETLCVDQDLFQNSYIRYLLSSLTRLILSNATNHHHHRYVNTKRVCLSYFSIKLLNILLILLQVFGINQILGIDFYSFGLNQMNYYFTSLANSDTLFQREQHQQQQQQLYQMNSHYFPLKSICVFRIRELTSTNSYAVVCSLPINLFIQFTFFVLFVWFLGLLSLNIIATFKWWSLLFKRAKRVHYVEKKLTSGLRRPISSRHDYESNSNNKKRRRPCCFGRNHFLEKHHGKDANCCLKCEFQFEAFFDLYMSADFVFLLRLCAINGNDVLVENLLVYFWMVFKNMEGFEKNFEINGVSVFF